MEEAKAGAAPDGAACDQKNFLRQFSIAEITAPLTLKQQEQLADDLIFGIKNSKEGKLPDYLEEFKKIYEGPNHLDAKLPAMSQLTPRSKRRLAVLPRPNESELQKIRKIEKLTKEKAGWKLYDELSKKNATPKSQQELSAESVFVPEVAKLTPIIPKNTHTDVVNNKAAEYIETVELYKRRSSDQMQRLERLFGMNRQQHSSSVIGSMTAGSVSSSAASNEFGSMNNSASDQRLLRSSSSQRPASQRAPSPSRHLQPMTVKTSTPHSASPSVSGAPSMSMTYNPVSSYPVEQPKIDRKYRPLPDNGARAAKHDSFIKEFTIKVYDQMGIDLNKEFNRLRNHTKLLQVLLLHFYQARLGAATARWRAVTKYLRELTATKAAKTIYRALRYFQFINQLNIRCERRLLAKQLEERRRIENEIFMNKTAALLTRNIRRYGKMKHIKYLVLIRAKATVIQAMVRAWKGRQIARKKRMYWLLINSSAIRIQCTYRRRLAIRKAMLNRKMKFVEEWIYEMEQKSALHRRAFTQMGAVSYISKAYRTYTIRRKLFKLIFYNHFVKALTIQRVYRGYHARKKLAHSLTQHRKLEQLQIVKAVVIQKYVRRMLAVRVLDALFEEKDAQHEQRYNHKLLRLAQGQSQGSLRRWRHRWRHWYWLTNPFVVQSTKALLIQRVYRGFHGRQRAAIIRIRNNVEALNTYRRRRFRASVSIQKAWRGFSTRARLARKRREHMAVRIQCLFRVCRARRRAKHLRQLNRSAFVLSRLLRRIIFRHRFHRKYAREQLLGARIMHVQRFFRKIKADRLRRSLLVHTRRLREVHMINTIHFVHLLARVQLQLLVETLTKPIHHRFYVVSKSDCLCLGPLQALFVVGVCGNNPKNPKLLDQQTLVTNKMDNNSLVKFLHRIDGMTDKDGAGVSGPAAGTGTAPGPGTKQATQVGTGTGLPTRVSSVRKEAEYLAPAAAEASLLHEVLVGDVPLPVIRHRLSNMEIDIIFSKSKAAQNVTHKLSYKEFLHALELIAGLHYSDVGVMGAGGAESPAQGRQIAPPDEEPNTSTAPTAAAADTATTELDPSIAVEMVDEGLAALREVYDEETEERGGGGFNLKKYVDANIKAINTRTSYFRPERMCADPHAATKDLRLALALRWLAFLRHEEFAQKVFAWLNVESRARLGLLVTRIQCLVRRRLARRRIVLVRAQQKEADRQALLRRTVTLIQSVARRFLAQRCVVQLAQRVLRKYVPVMGQPYWFHPYMRTKSFQKPRVLRNRDCYAIAVPETSLENVVRCYSCAINVATVNCAQCEDSMCRTCYDSLHCKGERAKHTATKIPVCAYCQFQMATRSCLTCVLERERPLTIKESIPRSERGTYCESCFLFEHQPPAARLPQFAASASPDDRTRRRRAVRDAGEQDQSQIHDHQPNRSHSNGHTHAHAHSQELVPGAGLSTHGAFKLLYQTSKESYFLRSLLRQRLLTNHSFEMLVQPCEECGVQAAAWRCFDCAQVYCHHDLISLHSINPAFAGHRIELLPYYTPDMHRSYRRDVARQEFLLQLERVRARAQLEKDEREFRCAVAIQAWWRMVWYGALGRRKMKKRRRKQRQLYRQRRRDDEVRATVQYALLRKLGRAPALSSDTREEKVLNALSAGQRPLATQYISRNKEDWGWFRVSRTRPRKGVFKTGFQVGLLEELHDQARRGGYRLPGRVLLRQAERQFTTTCDLRGLLHPGELVRIKARLFGVTAVDETSVKLNRLWREADVSPLGEVLYRVPTYRGEPQRLRFKLRYVAYDWTVGSPLVQLGLHAYKFYAARMMGVSMYFSQMNKKSKNFEEAAEWKHAAMRYLDKARWAQSYFNTGDAFLNLSSVTREEAERRAEQRKQSKLRADTRRAEGGEGTVKLYDDDEEDGDPDGSAQGDSDDGDEGSAAGSQTGRGAGRKSRRGKRKTSRGAGSDDLDEPMGGSGKVKPSSRSQRRSQRASRRSAKIAPGAGGDSDGVSQPGTPLSKGGKSSGAMSDSKASAAASGAAGSDPKSQGASSRQSARSKLKKSKKKAKPKDPWYASAEQAAERREREDKMSMADLAAQAGEWKEMVDIMTENIYYLNVNTNEMMTVVPRAVQAKRQLDFENSKNKIAFDQTHNRIKNLEMITKNRLLFTGGRRK